MIAHRLVEFVWLPTFERTSKRLLGEEDRRAIEAELCRDLEAGDLIKHWRLQKASTRPERWWMSGGVRVIYFPVERCGRVYMILAYGKGMKETLTRNEENELRKLATDLKNEDC